MSRPKKDPFLKKDYVVKVRLSEEELGKLDYICGHYNLDRSVILRHLIASKFIELSQIIG